MKRASDQVVSGLKELQDEILYNLDNPNKTHKRLGHDRIILVRFLDLMVEAGQYDVSPLEIDLHDLDVFSERDASGIIEFTTLVFGGFLARKQASPRAKKLFRALQEETPKNVELYDLRSLCLQQHFRVTFKRKKDAEERRKAELRKTIKTVDVVRLALEQQDNAKEAGPDYYPSSYRSTAHGEGFMSWLKVQTPDTWHVATECGFNGSLEDLSWVISNPNCDRATAATLYKYTLACRNPHQSKAGGPEMFEVIGRNWNSGFYKNSKFAWDLDLWILDYRAEYDATDFSDGQADWMIDPEELVAQEGSTPDSPFYSHDWRVYFKSQAAADVFYDADPENAALKAWLELCSRSVGLHNE